MLMHYKSKLLLTQVLYRLLARRELVDVVLEELVDRVHVVQIQYHRVKYQLLLLVVLYWLLQLYVRVHQLIKKPLDLLFSLIL